MINKDLLKIRTKKPIIAIELQALFGDFTKHPRNLLIYTKHLSRKEKLLRQVMLL